MKTAACLLSLCLAVPAFAQKPSGTKRWEAMDYGPFLSASVTLPLPKTGKISDAAADPKNVVGKGIVVRVGTKEHPASILFDTATCRYAAGWKGWVDLYGTPFDGTHRPPERSRPIIQGGTVFTTPQGPGWAAGDKNFNDPRKNLYSILPPLTAKWKGLYVHGDRVIFSYSVGNREVLDMPGLIVQEGQLFFTRWIRVGPGNTKLYLRPATLSNQVRGTLWTPDSLPGAGDVSWGGIAGGKVEGDVEIDGTEGPVVFMISVTGSPTEFGDPKVGGIDNPLKYIKGGPARFAQPVETVAKRGAGDGPYVVDTITAPDNNPWQSWMRFGGFDFFKDGRAAISTWNGDVWIVSGIDDRPDRTEKLTWKRFAAGLYQPLGLKIVDDKIYVLGRDQITRLHDLNNDGEADFYECFNNQVEITPNFHEFCLDLHTDPEGNFVFTKGAPLLGTELFDPLCAHNGCVLKVSKDGSKLDVVATGLRAPNGSSVGPDGQITCSDNEGIWVPACRLNWVKPGGFYGCMGTHHRETAPKTYDPPLCWLPHSKYVAAGDNSSGGQVWVEGDKWGLPAGTLLHMSYGTCGLFQVLHENVGGIEQGGVVRFPLQFATGIMRGRFNPIDGQLYVCGLKGWQTTGGADGALQRVRYIGKPLNSVAAMHVTKTGIDLTFTQPLDTASAADVGNYSGQMWNYAWTKAYGSPEFSVANPKKRVRDEVIIKAAKVSADGKTVSLEIPGIQPVMQMLIKISKLKTADGAVVNQEIYHTINAVP